MRLKNSKNATSTKRNRSGRILGRQRLCYNGRLMKIRIVAALMAMVLPGLVYSHLTWIDAEPRQNRVRIGHGHFFPVSEEMLNVAHVTAVLVDAEGKSRPLVLRPDRPFLTGDFVATAVPVLACFIQQPLIFTKTTAGMKKGSKRLFNQVVDSFRRTVCGKTLFHLSHGLMAAPLPADLLLEVRPDKIKLLLVVGQGTARQAVPGVEVSCFFGDDQRELSLGMTDRQGRVFCQPIDKGKYLFWARWQKQAASVDYDRELFEVSLSVEW